MWLRGTVHINKWASLLCICLHTCNDGFKRNGSHVFSEPVQSDTIRPRKTMHHNAYLHLTLSNGLGYCLCGLITESACGALEQWQASRQSWQISSRWRRWWWRTTGNQAKASLDSTEAVHHASIDIHTDLHNVGINHCCLLWASLTKAKTNEWYLDQFLHSEDRFKKKKKKYSFVIFWRNIKT